MDGEVLTFPACICNFVMMFETVSTVREIGYNYRRKLSAQRLSDYAIKFDRWQHPAMRCGATFAVPRTVCSYLHQVAMF